MMKGNPLDKTVKGIAASSRLSEETGHPGPGIKPCIAGLLESYLEKGGFPNRNETAVAIASELLRIGEDYDAVLGRLRHWNESNRPPLRPSDLERAVRNGFSGTYNYSCKNKILSSACVNEEICPYINKVVSKRKRVKNHLFIDYGWQHHLGSADVRIYFIALPYLEVKRQVGPGGLVFSNYSKISDVCNVSLRCIGKSLRVLQCAGLIRFQPGEAQKWKGIASEIQRILPIPRPTKTRIKAIKEFKLKKT